MPVPDVDDFPGCVRQRVLRIHLFLQPTLLIFADSPPVVGQALAYQPVMGWHMIFNRCVTIGNSASFMESNTPVFIEYLNNRISVYQSDPFAPMAIWNAIVVFVIVKIDVVIKLYLKVFKIPDNIFLSGQWF